MIPIGRCLLVVLLMLFIIMGCVPAQTPQNLDDTPGPSVVVTDRRYDAGPFSAEYPAGWRVITSPAGASPFVIFASPDNCAVILISTDAMDVPAPTGCEESASFRREEQTAGAARLALVAPGDAWDEYAPTFEQVVGSVNVTP